jgi:hypothetical protein
MSALVIAPDHVAALVARLRTSSDVMALCPNETVGGRTVRRVAARMRPVEEPEDWGHAAAIVREAGGTGDDDGPPIEVARVDVLCYAATEARAAAAARTVDAFLQPLDRRTPRGFTAAGCRVAGIKRVSGLIPVYDRDLRLHVRAMTYELLKGLIPVGA